MKQAVQNSVGAAAGCDLLIWIFLKLEWLGLGAYPLLRVLPLAVSLLQRVTFSRRRKGNPKGFAPAYGTSLGLSVPSLRCPSGGIAYGLLRCTSSRCMRLRRTALRAYPLMDTYARPAEGAESQKPDQEPEPEQIKRSQPSAAPTGDVFNLKNQVGWQVAIAGKPAPTEKPRQTACAFHHSTG
ncbi:hypothetical protein ACXR0M_26515 [Pseudomonas sp. Eth.TT006]